MSVKAYSKVVSGTDAVRRRWHEFLSGPAENSLLRIFHCHSGSRRISRPSKSGQIRPGRGGTMGKSSCVMDRFEVRELTAAFGPDAEAVMQEHREFRNKREEQEIPRFRSMASERMFCGRGLLIYNRFSIPSIMG